MVVYSLDGVGELAGESDGLDITLIRERGKELVDVMG